jgi:hypothetical protein
MNSRDAFRMILIPGDRAAERRVIRGSRLLQPAFGGTRHDTNERGRLSRAKAAPLQVIDAPKLFCPDPTALIVVSADIKHYSL